MSNKNTLLISKNENKQNTQRSKFTIFSLKIFGGLAKTVSNQLPSLRRALLKSGTRTPPENYLSVVIMYAFLSIPISLIGVYVNMVTGLMYSLLLLPIPVLVFGIGLAKPYLSFSSRTKGIDTELPYVISYFNLLSGGGISMLVTLRRLSRISLFPMISRESKQILTDVDMNGLDPVSAIERAAKNTPNKYFSDFLMGYTTLLKTGGRLGNYMDAKTREIFTQRVNSMESSSGTIGIFAEAYVAVTVVLGLCFYLIFTLQSIINQSGISGLSNAIFFSTVFIPMASVLFFYLVDAVQLKEEPGVVSTHYKTIFLSLLLVPIFIFLPYELPLYLTIGIGLMFASVPPMIKYEREIRKKRAIEAVIPIFMRDMAEVRKTGLSPERCIQQISKRDYGVLSKYVIKMSTQISWGLPIRKVMENFANNVHVWSAKTITFILLEIVDLGGGTANMFEHVAEFSQKMKEISKKQSAELKPLIFVPYFGAVMMVASSLMMMGFILTSSSDAGSADASFIQIALLTGCVTQSWIMGFASGKMGEGSMGAGFKHSIAMVGVSILTIYVMNNFF
ncbi:type II secretion system F family protein [Thermoproteota archaeon]